jgi:hypothetical protein
MIKIFTKLPVRTQTPQFQFNTKIIQSNTIEISTQLKKSIA